MTNTSTNIVQTDAMPRQNISSMPAGATSPMNAGIISQQQQINQQMALIGTSGGSKKSKRRTLIGGNSPVVLVPPIQSGSVNPQATGANYTELTKLSNNANTQGTFDNAKTTEDTATIATKQQALYKTGGSTKVGTWGCLSGGKKIKKRGRKSCKCKGKKKGTKKHRH